MRNVVPVKSQKRNKTSIILLSAGAGNRIKFLGPRPLLNISDSGENLLQRQVQLIRNVFDHPEIIIITGSDADKVMNSAPADIICVENESFATTNVTRGIGIGLRAATADKVLIIYGDLFFNKETLDNINYEQSSLVVDNKSISDENNIGCTINDENIVEHLWYGLPSQWKQIMFLSGRELKMMQTLSWNKDKGKLFGFELINEIIDKGGIFKATEPKGMLVVDIDSPKDLQQVKNLI